MPWKNFPEVGVISFLVFPANLADNSIPTTTTIDYINSKHIQLLFHDNAAA